MTHVDPGARGEQEKPTPGMLEVLPGSGGMIFTVGAPYGHGPMHVADMRGWGHLTGVGACNFDHDKAAAIQEANALRIVRAVNSHDDLIAELTNIAEADPSKWDPEVRGQFREWAQNRARAALRRAAGR